MKQLFLFFCASALLSACLPDDAYKMKYPQQEVHYGASHPLTFAQSEKVATDRLERGPVNSYSPAEQHPLKRKPITQTMKFVGQEDPDTGVKKVSRGQTQKNTEE